MVLCVLYYQVIERRKKVLNSVRVVQIVIKLLIWKYRIRLLNKLTVHHLALKWWFDKSRQLLLWFLLEMDPALADFCSWFKKRLLHFLIIYWLLNLIKLSDGNPNWLSCCFILLSSGFSQSFICWNAFYSGKHI